MSDPQPHLGFLRVAWATFNSPEAATAALSTIQAAHNKSTTVTGGEKKAEAAEEDEAKKEPATAEGETAPATASENDTEMTAQPGVPAEETAAVGAAAQPISPYSIGAYDLTHPGLLFIRLEPIEVRVRAAPACTSAPSRIRRDLETALQAVEVLEKQLVAPTAEGEAAVAGGQKGSAVIKEKRSAGEKEVEQRKETESLDEVPYERARDDVVSGLLSLSPLGGVRPWPRCRETKRRADRVSPPSPARRTNAPSTSRSPTSGTRSTCASTAAPCANRQSS